MLIWNTSSKNQKKQKHEIKTEYGLTNHLGSPFQQTLQKYSLNW